VGVATPTPPVLAPTSSRPPTQPGKDLPCSTRCIRPTRIRSGPRWWPRSASRPTGSCSRPCTSRRAAACASSVPTCSGCTRARGSSSVPTSHRPPWKPSGSVSMTWGCCTPGACGASASTSGSTPRRSDASRGSAPSRWQSTPARRTPPSSTSSTGCRWSAGTTTIRVRRRASARTSTTSRTGCSHPAAWRCTASSPVRPASVRRCSSDCPPSKRTGTAMATSATSRPRRGSRRSAWSAPRVCCMTSTFGGSPTSNRPAR